MKFRVLIGCFAAGVFLSILCFAVIMRNAPEVRARRADKEITDAVARFAELSRLGRYEELRKISTIGPEPYPDQFPHVPTNSRPSPRSVTILTTPKELQWKLIAESMNLDAEFISSFKEVWIKGNEGRVRVLLASRNTDGREIEWDFLLCKRDDEWKVFDRTHPNSFDRYGRPDNV